MNPARDDGPARLQGRGLPLAAQVHRRPGDARRARRPARAVRQPRARRARRRHRRLRQRRPSTATCGPGASRGGRHARDHRVDPRGARLPAQGGGRRRDDPRREERFLSPRDRVVAARPDDRDPRQPRRRAALDRVVRRPRSRRAATCTTTSWSRCSTICSASSRAAAARAPGPTATACSASTSSVSHEFEREITGGCEGIKPGWVRVNFNYFISDAVFQYIVDAVHLRRATTAGACSRDYRFDTDTGRWHAPRRAGRAAAAAARSATTTGELHAPTSQLAGDESLLAEYLRRGEAPRRGPRPGPHSPASLSEDFEALRWFDLPASAIS